MSLGDFDPLRFHYFPLRMPDPRMFIRFESILLDELPGPRKPVPTPYRARMRIQRRLDRESRPRWRKRRAELARRREKP